MIALSRYLLSMTFAFIYFVGTESISALSLFRYPSGRGSVEVYDMIGKLILSKQIENEFQNLDLTNFPTGIYLLKATNTNGFTQTHKIIKE